MKLSWLLFCSVSLFGRLISATTTYSCSSGSNIVITDPDYTVSCCGSSFTVTFGSSIEHVTPIQCSTLTSVTLSDSVTTIADFAFQNAYALSTLTFGRNLKFIGQFAFAYTALRSLTVPDSVTSIGKCAFQYCSSMTSVTFGNGLHNISDYAFQHSGLTTVTFSDSVEIVGYFSFAFTSITNIVWGTGLTLIHYFGFAYAYSGETLVLPDSITFLSNGAFYASTVKSITFGAGLQYLEGLAFYGCYDVESITFTGTNLTYFGGYSFYKSKLTSAVVPEGVLTLGNGAFANNDYLTTVSLPSTLVTIENNSFVENIALTEINIPDSVTYIGDYVFKDDTQLSCVRWDSTIQRHIGVDAFLNCPLNGCGPTAPPTTRFPTLRPSERPTLRPTTACPSIGPTLLPSMIPTHSPTETPTDNPTSFPTSVECPEGYAHDFLGSVDTKQCHFCQCVPCRAGQYAPFRSLVCIDAPAGHYSPINATDAYICPSGTYSIGSQTECTTTPAGYRSSIGASQPELCPANTYSTAGQEVCTHCPAGVLSAPGSTSLNSCVSAKTSFGISFVCLILSLFGFYVYIVGGRLHRMAFKRRQNLVRKCTVMYNKLCDIILALRDHYRLYAPSRIDEKLYYWVRVLIVIVCIAVVFLLFVFVFIYQTFYTCVILYRGYSHMPHVALPSLMHRFELYISTMESFSFSAVQYVSYPFRYVIDFLSTLSINFRGAQVSCAGAQIPVQLLANVIVIAVVVLIIESDMEVFWCSAFSNAHLEFRKLLIRPSLWENRIAVIFKHMMWSVLLQVIPHPRSLMQFVIGFFSLVAFFDDNYHAKHNANCDVGAYYKVDSFLAYTSTAVAYFAVFPLLLIFSQILVPRFMIDRGGVKPKRYIQKRLLMEGGKCVCGLPLVRHRNSGSAEFKCGMEEKCVCKESPDFRVFYGCPRYEKCGWVLCRACGNSSHGDMLFTVEYVRNLVDGNIDIDSSTMENSVASGRIPLDRSKTMTVHDLNVMKSKMTITGVNKNTPFYSGLAAYVKYGGSLLALDWLYARFAYSFGKSLVPVLDPASYKFGHKLSWIASRNDHTDEYEQVSLELEWTYIAGTAATYYRLARTVQEDLVPAVRTYLTCCSCGIEIKERYYFRDRSGYHICFTCEAVHDNEGGAALDLYELPNTWFQSLFGFVTVLISYTPIGQLMSERGRLIWKQVILNYMMYLRASVGWWSELESLNYGLMDRFRELLKSDAVITHQNIFDPTPVLDKANIEDENMQVMSAVISSRLVLLQMIPYLTLYSAFAVNLCSCPILLQDKELIGALPPLFVVENLTQMARETVMDVGILPTWQVWPMTVYLFFCRSRGVQFIVNALTSLIAVVIVFSSNTDLVVTMMIFSLTLVVIQGAIAAIFPIVLIHYVLFPSEKVIHCEVVGLVEDGSEAGDAADKCVEKEELVDSLGGLPQVDSVSDDQKLCVLVDSEKDLGESKTDNLEYTQSLVDSTQQEAGCDGKNEDTVDGNC